MRREHRTTTSPLAIIALALIALAPLVFAHGGFDHVRGTVVSVNNNILTVKTSTGNVDVKLDSKTQLTKDGGKAQMSDLVPGARVIVEAPHAKDKAAQSVKIGAAGGTAATQKQPTMK